MSFLDDCLAAKKESEAGLGETYQFGVIAADPQNPRDLPINPATGRFVDHVAAAYHSYLLGGGDKTFVQWHDSQECPQHGMCSECVR